jgi:hypothetical protein
LEISLLSRLSRRTLLPRVTERLGKKRGLNRPLFGAGRLGKSCSLLETFRRSGRKKGDSLSKARRLRLSVGTFVLALSVILSGCSGSVTQEQKQEKMKMLKKKEETDKEKRKEK